MHPATATSVAPHDRPARNPVIPKHHLHTPEMHRETMRPGGGGVESAGRPASGRTPRPRPACWPSENRGGRVKVIRGHGNDQADGEPRGHQCLQFRAITYPGVLPVWLLMLWGPWVVHYKTPPVLLHVAKPDKNMCVWGGTFDRAAFPTDNPINVHECATKADSSTFMDDQVKITISS